MMDSVFNLTQLLQDLTTWLLGLIPLGGALMLGYHALMKNAAVDDPTAAQHSRSMRNVIFGTIFGMAGSGLIKFVLRYVAGS